MCHSETLRNNTADKNRGRNNRYSSLVTVFLQANISLRTQVFQNVLILEDADTTFIRNVGEAHPNTVVSQKT